MLNLMANMASSVLGAGAYPLPPTAMADVGLSFLSGNRRYAFRSFCSILTVLSTLSGLSRAGFFTGILFLVVLSAVTDWTIRLIATNAKLSGIKSYIGPVGALLFSFPILFRARWCVSVCHDVLRTNVLIQR